MSIPYALTGRTNQKARTRNALIRATRQLLAQAVTPTVEQAAAAASISRTTAYRYFPNQRALLVAAYPELEARSLLGANRPTDPEERLEIVVGEYLRLTVENEPELRTMLRLSLDPHPTDHGELELRKGRVIGWLEDALTPLRDQLPGRDLRRLVLAIRSAAGIEALVWLTDVAGLSREQAVEVMGWSARALLRAALAESGPGNREHRRAPNC